MLSTLAGRSGSPHKITWFSCALILLFLASGLDADVLRPDFSICRSIALGVAHTEKDKSLSLYSRYTRHLTNAEFMRAIDHAYEFVTAPTKLPFLVHINQDQQMIVIIQNLVRAGWSTYDISKVFGWNQTEIDELLKAIEQNRFIQFRGENLLTEELLLKLWNYGKTPDQIKKTFSNLGISEAWTLERIKEYVSTVLTSVNRSGKPKDRYHPIYGYIVRDNVIQPEVVALFVLDHYEMTISEIAKAFDLGERDLTLALARAKLTRKNYKGRDRYFEHGSKMTEGLNRRQSQVMMADEILDYIEEHGPIRAMTDIFPRGRTRVSFSMQKIINHFDSTQDLAALINERAVWRGIRFRLSEMQFVKIQDYVQELRVEQAMETVLQKLREGASLSDIRGMSLEILGILPARFFGTLPKTGPTASVNFFDTEFDAMNALVDRAYPLGLKVSRFDLFSRESYPESFYAEMQEEYIRVYINHFLLTGRFPAKEYMSSEYGMNSNKNYKHDQKGESYRADNIFRGESFADRVREEIQADPRLRGEMLKEAMKQIDVIETRSGVAIARHARIREHSRTKPSAEEYLAMRADIIRFQLDYFVEHNELPTSHQTQRRFHIAYTDLYGNAEAKGQVYESFDDFMNVLDLAAKQDERLDDEARERIYKQTRFRRRSHGINTGRSERR